MIEYIEVRGEDKIIIGIVDTANTVIWHSVYFGVGDFEIHAPATPEIVSLLKVGRYVTRPDNDNVGIIEKILISESADDGATIAASGRFAKSLLDRRIIYNLSGFSNKATILRGNVESAVREVVKNNAIACPFDSNRNIPALALGEESNFTESIVGQKQVSYENLLTYTDGLLEEFGLSAKCVLRKDMLLYTVYGGTDRSINNTGGKIPIVFSKEYDNLTSNEYTFDESTEKNVALIGGEGEGIDRFYTTLNINSNAGLNRREIFVDASSVSKKYKDDNDVEQTYTDAIYIRMLKLKGQQDIAPLVKTETFVGVLDVTNGNFVYGRDFTIGDIVTVQNNSIGKYINARIREVLESQDENGYTVEVTYQ